MLLKVYFVKPIFDWQAIIIVSYDFKPFSLELVFALSHVYG
jgi:hypothetical protein